MSNISNLLPDTTHVHMPWCVDDNPDNWFKRDGEMAIWLKENTASKVTLIAWEADTPLDYHFVYVVDQGTIYNNSIIKSYDLYNWAIHIERDSGCYPEYIYAFDDPREATLFKLLFGGNA